MNPRLLLIAGAVALSSTLGVSLVQQRRSGAFDQSINHPAIQYLTADTDTVVDRLNQKLRDGSARLVYDQKTGYLKSVLDLLQVPVESQVMVYTQTSLQAPHIKMDNPRAIYFNDTVSDRFSTPSGRNPRSRRRSAVISSASAATCRGTRSASPASAS